MKSLEELKQKAEEFKQNKEYKDFNFMSYSVEEDKYRIHDEYSYAKNFAEKGGQVLVIDKDKVYEYKVKNDDEYFKYLSNQLKYENITKMNIFGL